MSATLSGLIVLENARPDDDGPPLSVLFDGQMWLGPGRILTGTFRYYNSSNYSFPEVGNYFAWIHVAKFTPELPVPVVVVHAQVPVANGAVAADSEPQPGTERQPSREEQQKDEEVATGSSGAGDGPTSSDALEEPATGSDMLHVVGDIVQLIPTTTDDMRQQAYINVSGAAVNPNRTDSFFDINAAQYTSHYKNSRQLSVLPVRAHFNLNKYRARKPMPSDNTYVSVDGFLIDVETDAAGHATLFHLSIDNISFLGRAGTYSPSIIGGLGPSTPSRSSRFKYDFGALSPSPSPFSQVSTPNTPSTSATLCSEPESPTRAPRRIMGS